MKPYMPRLPGESVAEHADRRHAVFAAELDARIEAMRNMSAPILHTPIYLGAMIGDGRYVRR